VKFTMLNGMVHYPFNKFDERVGSDFQKAWRTKGFLPRISRFILCDEGQVEYTWLVDASTLLVQLRFSPFRGAAVPVQGVIFRLSRAPTSPFRCVAVLALFPIGSPPHAAYARTHAFAQSLPGDGVQIRVPTAHVLEYAASHVPPFFFTIRMDVIAFLIPPPTVSLKLQIPEYAGRLRLVDEADVEMGVGEVDLSSHVPSVHG